jgi:RND family efflux transporter MFP subunit
LKKKLIIGTILLASIVGLLAFNLAKSNSRPEVSLVEAAEGTLSESVYAAGTLHPAAKAEYYVPYSGVAERVFVEAGDRVKSGDTLFVMDTEALEEQIRLEENNLEMIRIEERMYRENRMEAVKLELMEGREPESLFDENELELYRLRTERSMMAMETLRSRIGKREVKADMDGVVSALHLKTGQAAAEGAVAVELVDDRNLLATAYLNELDAGNVREGMEVIITGDSFQDALPGRVAFVSPIAAPANPSRSDPSVEIRVKLEQVPDTLRPGLTVYLEILLPAEPRVLVPLTAVRFSGEEAFVYEVKDGYVVQRAVTTGKDDGEQVEILSGLAAGERIIGMLTNDIADGVQVSVHD